MLNKLLLKNIIKSFTYTGTTNSLCNLTTNVSATNKVPVFADIGATNAYNIYISSTNFIGVKILNTPDTSITVTIYYIETN